MTVRYSDQSPPPARVTSSCSDCGFKGSSLGMRSAMLLAKDHGVYCAMQQARDSYERETATTKERTA